MATLPFNMALVQFLAEHRNIFLTKFFLAASSLGDIEGYIAITTLMYVMWDKKLAIRLSILVLLTASLNYLLKIIIKNPRPFMREGTYVKEWAVSAKNAAELATEYSTPSGHAMAASSFYSYLYVLTRNRYVRVIAIALPILIGLSRPYLGVHYMEDVLLGWAIGFSVALIPIKYADRMSTAWNNLSHMQQIGIAVAASSVFCLLGIVINGWRIGGQPRAFLGYAGFLTGIVIARPLELGTVNFAPKSSTVAAKILRYVLTVAMVIFALLILDSAFAMIADKFSLLGYLLQYVRYTAAGIVCIFLAPLLFTKLRLAEIKPIAKN